MRVTEKGQVTIPKDLRDALGIGAGTEVEFERRQDAIVVRKAKAALLGATVSSGSCGSRRRTDDDRRDHGPDPSR